MTSKQPTPNIDALADALGSTLERRVGGSLLDRSAPSGKLPANVFLLGLVRDRKLYRAALGLVTCGASATSAFGSVGVPGNHVSNWAYTGAQDIARGEDTYYARFALDLMRSRNTAIADAEIAVKQKKPEVWLVQTDHSENTLMVENDHSENTPVIDSNLVAQMVTSLKQLGALSDPEVFERQALEQATSGNTPIVDNH